MAGINLGTHRLRRAVSGTNVSRLRDLPLPYCVYCRGCTPEAVRTQASYPWRANCQWLLLNAFCVVVLMCVVTFGQTPATKINLNTATAAQLETLPGIGAGLAKRILEHRVKHGPFKRPQDIIVIRGLSAKRYRLIAPYLTT